MFSLKTTKILVVFMSVLLPTLSFSGECSEMISEANEKEFRPRTYQYYGAHNLKEKIKRCIKEAEQDGLTGAKGKYLLGLMYLHGVGVENDSIKGMKWLKLSALHGFQESFHEIARAYQFGYGVGIDKKEAFMWHRRAAYKGHIESAKKTAQMLWDGEGTERSGLYAYAWYKVASRHGDESAERSMKYIGKMISAKRKTLGNELASDFLKKIDYYFEYESPK